MAASERNSMDPDPTESHHPVSASQGPLRSLPAKIRRLLSEPEHGLHEGGKEQLILLDLKNRLQELIDGYLMEPSEVEYPALTAKCWVEEVREMSYDIDNFLDEVVQVKAAQKKLRGRIARFRHGRSRSRWFAGEVSRFLALVQEVIQRHERYKLNNLDKRSTAAGSSVECPLPPLLKQAAVLGCLDDSKLGKLLVQWLTTDEEGGGERRLNVASIVGYPGVGKTTLANEVYRKHGRRFDCRAFVRSSRKPNINKLLTSILLQVRPCQPPDASELCNLASTIRAHLQSKRYLIVIDDLWASSTWDFIHQAFPHDNSLSRILTTTEVEVVAHRCCGHNSKHIFKMEPLSKETANKLFFSRFVGGQSEFPGPSIADTPKNLSIKKKISSEIVNIFGDFPLVIIAIASLLARQPNLNQWNYIWSSVVPNLKTNPPIEGIEQVLSLCYTGLPDHLKTCMLYFSLYQENEIIWKDDLVEMWIAEDFISVKEGKDMKEVACTYFDELVKSGMIQPVHINHNDEVLSCTVHYMILQLIQDKSIEENFVTTIHHSETNIGLGDKVHRLSLHFGDAEDVKVPVNLRILQVRSLAFYGPFRCKPSLAELRFLRVIILQLWGDQDNIKFEMVTVCNLLRYLEIACNVTLKLQIQLKDLQYLETLKIDSRVSEVPQDIVHLPRLLHLRLPGDTNLPNGFGCMSSLQTLGCFDLSSNSTDNVQSLGKLTNLCDLRLTFSNMLSENIEEKFEFMATVLSNLRNLKSLALLIPAAGSSNASIISCDGLSSVSPPPVHVEKLELSPRNFIFSRLPRWIGDLGKLSTLKIAARELSQGDIDILKKLNALAALSLHVRTIPAKRIIFDKEGFPVLKHFKFVCPALFIMFKKGALPDVRRLKIGFNCNRLEQYSPADASFQNLTGLEVVSAKIGCEFESVSGRQTVESALNDAFSNCARRLVICLQWVDWIFYGDREVPTAQPPADVVKRNSTEDKDRRDDNRITLPLESLSCAPKPVADSSAGLNKVGNKSATVMENAMISVSTGAMNSLLMKLETLRAERYTEVTGMAEQGLILKDELYTMNRLLKQLSNTAEQNMVICRNKMRELTYEIEDSIDDILFSNIYKEAGSTSSQHRIMPHGFIDQIQKLKAEVEEAQVQSMENKTEMQTFERSSMSREQLLSRVRDEQNGLVGMDGPRERLVEQLLGSTQECVQGVCILGVAGIGKTTLARQVYNEIKWQFDSYVFICASKKVDSSYKDGMAWLCTSILSQLQKNGNIQDTNKDMPTKRVWRCLKGKRFLVVIDGVWSADTLTNIKLALPENNSGSRIIVTTRSSDVAESCGKHLSTSTYQMDRLKFEQSLSLFRSIIFGSGRSCPIVMGKGLEEIVQACDGVPLAVRVVAGVLSSKPAEMEQWTTLRALSKQEGLDQFDIEWLREILDIGYSDLRCDLKTCLLYLSAFPENRVFRKDRLIRRWAAEGFLTESGEETLWETGESYFLELIARKLIEPVYDEEDVMPIGCKISGSVYDFIASLSSEENLVTLDATDETFIMQHGVSVRRLSVDLSSDDQEIPVVLFQGEESSKIRSLTIMGDFHFGWTMPDLWTFKHVRVLDLEDSKGLETKNLECIGRLYLLRYLGIGGTNATRLPQEIMALEQLTTLDIRRTRVRNLPACGATKLVSLLADAFILWRGMERMQKLEEISKVLVGGDGSLPSELVGLVNKLRRLRMLGVRFGRLYERNETDRQGVKHFLEEVGKSCLQSLLLDNCLHWLLDVLVESWAGVIMPPQLRKFELRVPSCLAQVPQKVASLVALTHLHIRVSQVEPHGVRALGSLPNLDLLKLQSDSSCTLTVSREDGFRWLKVFWYDCQCGGGMGLQFEAGAMPQLRRLRLDLNVRETISRFGSFDFGIQRLSSLSHVFVTTDCKGTSAASEVEAAENKIRDQASQNPKRPVLELKRSGHSHLVPQRGQFSIAKVIPAVPAEGSVITIHSLEDWTKQIDEANRSDPKKLVVVDFTASWCRPSLEIAPFVAHLSDKFPDVVFLKVDVDVDGLKDLSEAFGVEGMPTFVFMKDGEVKDRLEGAHEEELLNKFRQQMPPT